MVGGSVGFYFLRAFDRSIHEFNAGIVYLHVRNQARSTGGLVGYDDWFTPSRSGVRFPPCVSF